jgi:hypothetical protein
MPLIWDLRSPNVTYAPRQASLRIRREMDTKPTSQTTALTAATTHQSAPPPRSAKITTTTITTELNR